MTQAENEVIETFCRELALALRRITGREVDISPEALAKEVKDSGGDVDEHSRTNSCLTCEHSFYIMTSQYLWRICYGSTVVERKGNRNDARGKYFFCLSSDETRRHPYCPNRQCSASEARRLRAVHQ